MQQVLYIPLRWTVAEQILPKKRAVARARAYVQFHQDETYLRISEIGIFQIQDSRWLKIVFVHLRHGHFRLD